MKIKYKAYKILEPLYMYIIYIFSQKRRSAKGITFNLYAKIMFSDIDICLYYVINVMVSRKHNVWL